LSELFFSVAPLVFWCAGVIWFGVFMCSEKPIYARTPEHTNGTEKKNSSDNAVM